jgi:Matrixin
MSGKAARRAWPLAAAISASLLSAFLIVTPVWAWTQLVNNYPDNPVSCDNSTSWPCIAWPKNGPGTSSTVYVYLDPTLTQANLDLSTDVRNSMSKWNAICAVNPYLYVGTGVNYNYGVYRGSLTDPTAWAETNNIYYTNSPHYIIESDTTFSSSVTWNHTYTYDVYVADSRKVGTHELGHGEGLGHTGYTAVMHQGAESFWVPQSNDIQGMQHIYGSC